MGKKTEEIYTVMVAVANTKTGEVQRTRFRCDEDGVIEETGTKTLGGSTAAVEILREVVAAQEDRTPIKARSLGAGEEFGVWYEVAKKTKEESLCRDGDGNYHLITTERAGGSEEGLKVAQKRSRELMSEDDARYWALENLRMEEYEKAFPNE